MSKLRTSGGFTLIEVVLVILIIGIISGVAVSKLESTIETAQYEQTKQELDRLASAIVGDPAAYGSGSRVDFGYVGDVGALPPSLEALVSNPGGYASWQGPYISTGKSTVDFKQDGWSVNYLLQDTLIRSTGSGSNIDKVFAGATADLLQNVVEGIVLDASATAPGSTWDDQVQVDLVYPNGSGGTTTATTQPIPSGHFSFSNVPIGIHHLRVIFLPRTDTVTMPVTVYPKKTTRLEVVFPADLW